PKQSRNARIKHRDRQLALRHTGYGQIIERSGIAGLVGRKIIFSRSRATEFPGPGNSYRFFLVYVCGGGSTSLAPVVNRQNFSQHSWFPFPHLYIKYIKQPTIIDNNKDIAPKQG